MLDVAFTERDQDGVMLGLLDREPVMFVTDDGGASWSVSATLARCGPPGEDGAPAAPMSRTLDWPAHRRVHPSRRVRVGTPPNGARTARVTHHITDARHPHRRWRVVAGARVSASCGDAGWRSPAGSLHRAGPRPPGRCRRSRHRCAADRHRGTGRRHLRWRRRPRRRSRCHRPLPSLSSDRDDVVVCGSHGDVGRERELFAGVGGTRHRHAC